MYEFTTISERDILRMAMYELMRKLERESEYKGVIAQNRIEKYTKQYNEIHDRIIYLESI